MDPTGWWGVVLGGIVGAGFGGAVAAVTAWYVVHKAAEQAAALEHRTVLRQRVADVAIAAAEVPGCTDSLELVRAYWRLQGREMSLLVELGPEHTPIREFVLEADDALSSCVMSSAGKPVTESTAAEAGKHAALLQAGLVRWAEDGLLAHMPPRSTTAKT